MPVVLYLCRASPQSIPAFFFFFFLPNCPGVSKFYENDADVDDGERTESGGSDGNSDKRECFEEKMHTEYEDCRKRFALICYIKLMFCCFSIVSV